MSERQTLRLPPAVVKLKRKVFYGPKDFEFLLGLLQNNVDQFRKERTSILYTHCINSFSRLVGNLDRDPADKVILLFHNKFYESLMLDSMDKWFESPEFTALRCTLMKKIITSYAQDPSTFVGCEEKIVFVLENFINNLTFSKNRCENETVIFVCVALTFYNLHPTIFDNLTNAKVLMDARNLPSIAFTQCVAVENSPYKQRIISLLLQVSSKISIFKSKFIEHNFPLVLLKPTVKWLLSIQLKPNYYQMSNGKVCHINFADTQAYKKYAETVREYVEYASMVKDGEMVKVFARCMAVILNAFLRPFNNISDKDYRSPVLFSLYHMTVILLMAKEDIAESFKHIGFQKWETPLTAGMLYQADVLDVKGRNYEEEYHKTIHQNFLTFIGSLSKMICEPMKCRYFERVGLFEDGQNNDWLTDLTLTAFENRPKFVAERFLAYEKYFRNGSYEPGKEAWSVKVDQSVGKYLLLRLELFFFYPREDNIEFARFLGNFLVELNSVSFTKTLEFRSALQKLNENIYSKRHKSMEFALESLKVDIAKISATVSKSRNIKGGNGGNSGGDTSETAPLALASHRAIPYDFFNNTLKFLNLDIFDKWVKATKKKLTIDSFSYEEFQFNCSTFEDLILSIYCLDKSLAIVHHQTL